MVSIIHTNADFFEQKTDWQISAKKTVKDTQESLGEYPEHGGINLIALRYENGSTQVVSANSGSGWRNINNWHLILREFLEKKLRADAPVSESLRMFFDVIDDAAAANAARQLVAAECGTGVKYEKFGELHNAVLQVTASLRALGVAVGDWTFFPILNAYLGEKN